MLLCPYEIRVLRSLAEPNDPNAPRTFDGAAFNHAIECLRGSGYIDKKGDVTPRGRKVLDAR